MDCFNKAVITILEHEGGFSNHEADPGGATNYGISLRWLKTQGLLGDLDSDGDVDIDDIKALTHEDAVRIYHNKWWDKYHYDRVTDCTLATKIFDMSVNMGGYRAHKLVQYAIRAIGITIVVDGIIGPQTITAINTAPADTLLDAIRAEQKRFYLGLIARDQTLAIFRKGGLRRAQA